VSQYETAQRLQDWIKSSEPVNIWKLERFDDVLWEAHKDKATMASYTMAGIEHPDVMGLPFPEAMRLGRAVLDGPVFRMVETWLKEHRLPWNALRYQLENELWLTYRVP